MWLSKRQIEINELKAIASAKPCNVCGELSLKDHACPAFLHVDDMQRLKGHLSVRCAKALWTQLKPRQISRQGVATWYCRRCKCKHKARIFEAVPPAEPRQVPTRPGRETREDDTFGT